MSLREKLYAQPDEEENTTLQRLFRVNEERAAIKILVECADRHPEKWLKVHKMITESNILKNTGNAWCWYSRGREWLLDAMSLFKKEVADDEYRKELNRIGGDSWIDSQHLDPVLTPHRARRAFQHVWLIKEAKGLKVHVEDEDLKRLTRYLELEEGFKEEYTEKCNEFCEEMLMHILDKYRKLFYNRFGSSRRRRGNG